MTFEWRVEIYVLYIFSNSGLNNMSWNFPPEETVIVCP